MTRFWLSFFALFMIVPSAALPQGEPLGPEFRVNTYTPGAQRFPSVSADPSGNFVVVWTSYTQDGSSSGVFGQRYADSGLPLGPEFRVNTHTTSFQESPSVVLDPSGSFVVVWSSDGQDGESFGVFGQRYDSAGAPVGPEFRVNTSTTKAQVDPSLASDSLGNFVVVWESRSPRFFLSDGIFGQRYSNSGAPLGPEFRVNTTSANFTFGPVVASDSAGNFVVAWTRSGGYASTPPDVFAQRFASTGAPLGPEFRVNTQEFGYQTRGSVASDSSGNFVVAWDSGPPPGTGSIIAQRFAGTGEPLGPEFLVNSDPFNQSSPSVASDPAGNFVVTWVRDLDGSFSGVFGKRYGSAGAPLGLEFRVNTHTTNDQQDPSVAADSFGRFVVVWESFMEDGANYGIFAQRFGPIVPVELMGFGVE